jgi:hypothetical protein
MDSLRVVAVAAAFGMGLVGTAALAADSNPAIPPAGGDTKPVAFTKLV